MMFLRPLLSLLFFFFNDTATTEIYTLSLHDALPISSGRSRLGPVFWSPQIRIFEVPDARRIVDRKSTRLNSSHGYISYAVFCLKKKKNSIIATPLPTVNTTGYIDHASFLGTIHPDST